MVRGIGDPMLVYKPRKGFPKGYLLGGEPDVLGNGLLYPMELSLATFRSGIRRC